MFRPRHLLFTAGVLLLLLGGWFSWRNAQPVLTDEQQITATLESLRLAVENRNSKRVSRHLTQDFTWNGQPKSELQNGMNGAFWQLRDVTANIIGLEVSVHGEKASALGKFSFAYKPNARSSSEAMLGEFKLQLVKRDGEWLVLKAEGGPSLSP